MSRAQVVYYLSHGGRLEQPHLIEVERRSENALSLIDVKNRLRNLRGKEMPDAFSWAYKRSYKNDFIWSDVSENDVILPLGSEYVLKGSENVYSRGIYEAKQEKAMVQDEVHHRPYSTPKPKTSTRSPKTSLLVTPEASSLRVNRQLMTEFKETLRDQQSDDSSNGDFTDVRVYKTPASPITADHGLDAATQTTEEEGDDSRRASSRNEEAPRFVSRRNLEELGKQKPSSATVLKQLLSCGGIDTSTCPSMQNNNRQGPSWAWVKPKPDSTRGYVSQDPESMPEVVKETTCKDGGAPKPSPIQEKRKPEMNRVARGSRRVEGSSPRFSGARRREATPALKTLSEEPSSSPAQVVKWAELSPPKKELRCKDDRPLTPGRSRLDWEKSLQEAVTTSTPPADFRQSLQECPQCARTFKPDSLKVHLRGCHGSQRPPRQSMNVARRLE